MPSAAAAPMFKVKSSGLDINAALAKKGKAADHVMSEAVERAPPPPDVLNDVEVGWIDAGNLFNKLQFGSNLIVVDCRSGAAFEATHVRAAISVPLADIEGKALVDVESDVLPGRFRQRRTDEVVVYDDDSVEGGNGDVATFLKAMQEDRRAAKKVLAVKGGLKAVEAKFPFLVKGNDAFSDSEYPSMILPDFLFLGAWNAAKNREVLDHLGITYVVNATAVCENVFKADEAMNYIQCALDDKPGADIRQFFTDTIAFMEEAEAKKGKVLIHCQMGMSRSSTLVILWLMVKHKMNLREATALTRGHRPFINPNPGFLKQLGLYEVELFGSTTIRFPDGPITLRTIYEWLQADGETWVKRKVVGYAD